MLWNVTLLVFVSINNLPTFTNRELLRVMSHFCRDIATMSPGVLFYSKQTNMDIILCTLLIVAVGVSLVCAQKIRPVVLMHGITCDASCMSHVVDWIHDALGEDVYVR